MNIWNDKRNHNRRLKFNMFQVKMCESRLPFRDALVSFNLICRRIYDVCIPSALNLIGHNYARSNLKGRVFHRIYYISDIRIYSKKLYYALSSFMIVSNSSTVNITYFSHKRTKIIVPHRKRDIITNYLTHITHNVPISMRYSYPRKRDFLQWMIIRICLRIE